MSGSRPVSGEGSADVPTLARQMHLFGALARVARRAVRRRVAIPELPDAQVEVLRTVQANPGLGTRAVADRLQLVPNTVSTLVGELVTAGLLTRARAVGDRRNVHLYLTEEAQERLRRWGAAREEVLSAALRRLDETDRRALLDALPAVRRLLTVLDPDDAGQLASARGTTTGQPVTGSRSTQDSTP